MGISIDFDYEINTDTDKQGGGGIVPHGHYRIWAEAIEFPKTKDEKGRQAAIIFEIQEPVEFKNRKFREWWTMIHSEEFGNSSYRFGKPAFDRFCRAVQVVVERGTDSDELLFKSFVVEIGIQPGNGTDANGKPYQDKNQIRKFFYEDDQAKEPVPELGVIGDGTMPAKAASKPANDNKAVAPAANAAPAAAKKTPWGAKKAA
ncbi:hypothetical protein [Mesorhizobium sp. B2-2-4]|uniref:hypothetical protein n=1 Tax=Mesorhizobium sp. B2-2-4 TaxID=2589962 RepID=UPI001AEDC398|nr:hypothetical protein [Mesorhizobium sp. B2-2-4]